MRYRCWIGAFSLIIWGATVMGAVVPPTRPPINKPGFDGVPSIFYVPSYETLEKGIIESSRRQALYSYILANISTPGFEPIRYLPPDDVKLLRATIPDLKLTKDVVLDFIMTRMSENSKRQSSYVTMWKGKKDSLTRIVTLGK